MNTAERMDFYEGLLADLDNLNSVLGNAALQANGLLKQPELGASGELFRSLLDKMPIALSLRLHLGDHALQGVALLDRSGPHTGHLVPLAAGSNIDLDRFSSEGLAPRQYHVGNNEVFLSASQVAVTLQQGGRLDIG